MKPPVKVIPEHIVNDFVTNVIHTVPIRPRYTTIRVTLKNDKSNDKTSRFYSLTGLSVVCRNGCLVHLDDLVVKTAPKNKKLRQCICVRKLFEREAFLYNTIFVELAEFQKGFGVKGFEGPVLIGASLDEDQETLILQNNETYPKFDKWIGDLEPLHKTKVLEEFSKLHALSFAFAKHNPQRFKEFKDELKEGNLSCLENSQTISILRKNIEQTLSYFEKDEADKLSQLCKDLTQVFDSDMDVLVHGDATNALFCYEKQEDLNLNVVSSAKLIDWQLVRFGSPAFDLSVFFFTHCLDDLGNLEQFLASYHQNLTIFLTAFKCKVDDFLSFQQLEQHWKKHARFGLAVQFLDVHQVNANNESLDVDEFLQEFVKPPTNEFLGRIKKIVKFCVDSQLI